MILEEEKNSTVILASIFAGIFASTGSLTQILINIFAGFQGSVMTLLYIAVTLAVMWVGFILQRNKYCIYNVDVCVLALLLILYYLFTDLFVGPPFTKIHYFIVFTIVAFITPSLIAIDEKVFIRTVIYLSILGIPYINEMFTLDYNNNISMGSSYAFLFPVISTIVYFLHYFKSDNRFCKILDIIALVANALYFYMMIAFGSRGPIICILSYMVYFLLVEEKSYSIVFRKGKFIIVVILGIILLLNFLPILTFFSNFVKHNFGVNLNFIDKFIRMSYDGDMSNGRVNLLQDTINGICDNPFFGHGCDLYYLRYSNYPHNFLLQMMYDMGIIISFIFLVFLCNRIKNHATSYYNQDKFLLIMLLLFASVPGALFSNDLWNNVVLWLFFGSVFSRTFSYKANYI